LTVLASPAYMINVGHVMSEKLAIAFCFASLWALLASDEPRKARLFWLSAGLAGMAVLSKYLCTFLLPAVVGALYARRELLRRSLLWLGAAMLLPALYFALKPEVILGALIVSAQAAGGFWAAPTHRLRSFLAFTGGLGFPALIPWLLAGSGGARPWLAAMAAAGLFVPAFDLVPGVRGGDRLCGVIFGASGAMMLTMLGDPATRRVAAWRLGGLWAAAGALIAFSYWSIIARVVLFAIPPLILLSAATVERAPGCGARPWQWAGLIASLGLSLGLATVDHGYASAQKEMAAQAFERFPGRRIWCAGHLGLHHYLRAQGALELDLPKDGWSKLRPGDVIVSSRTNAFLPPPHSGLELRRIGLTVRHPLALRLISGWGGEGGFYSNISGFLPFSVSSESLEEFLVAEIL
jgi:hypothetical protein